MIRFVIQHGHTSLPGSSAGGRAADTTAFAADAGGVGELFGAGDVLDAAGKSAEDIILCRLKASRDNWKN